MKSLRHEEATQSGLRLSSSENAAFSIKQAARRFQDLPAHKQQEIRQRVIALLREEKQRNQAQRSALWKQALTVYGVNPHEL